MGLLLVNLGQAGPLSLCSSSQALLHRGRDQRYVNKQHTSSLHPHVLIPSSIHLFINESIHLSPHPFIYSPIHSSIYQLIYSPYVLSILLFTFLIYSRTFYPFIHLFTYQFIYSSKQLSISLSICLSVVRSICSPSIHVLVFEVHVGCG